MCREIIHARSQCLNAITVQLLQRAHLDVTAVMGLCLPAIRLDSSSRLLLLLALCLAVGMLLLPTSTRIILALVLVLAHVELWLLRELYAAVRSEGGWYRVPPEACLARQAAKPLQAARVTGPSY